MSTKSTKARHKRFDGHGNVRIDGHPRWRLICCTCGAMSKALNTHNSPHALVKKFEQLGWEVPDVVVYPTGGGTGLVGIWKALEELEQLGWIGSRRPRMIAVQTEGCAPIVRAFEKGLDHAPAVENARTKISGLRVPAAVADSIMLGLIRRSGGTALTVSDDEALEGMREIASSEGVFAAPEGGAVWAGIKKLVDRKAIDPDERVVLMNTGTGLKYGELVSFEFPVVDRVGS